MTFLHIFGSQPENVVFLKAKMIVSYHCSHIIDMDRMTSKSTNDRFTAPATFMSAPFAEAADGSDVAVFGVPFDCGTSKDRIGARHGPDAIRQQSVMLGAYHERHPTVDIVKALNLVDLGNVDVTPGLIEPSFDAIAAASRTVSETGCVPLTFGGDGAMSLPQLRGLAAVHPDLVCLHIDSHTDTYPGTESDASPYTTATTFHRAAEEGIIDPAHSVHLGFHGDSSIPNATQPAIGLGYHVITLDQMLASGIEYTVTSLMPILANRPTYICFDMDIFDPSCAPGVCSPTWGGLNVREGIGLIRQLENLNIVAVDINTVSPPHDPGNMTAWLAATIAFEFLAVLYSLNR
jgi:agmatinase